MRTKRRVFVNDVNKERVFVNVNTDFLINDVNKGCCKIYSASFFFVNGKLSHDHSGFSDVYKYRSERIFLILRKIFASVNTYENDFSCILNFVPDIEGTKTSIYGKGK